jgi:dolichol-phosphate mannosyltransferase
MNDAIWVALPTYNERDNLEPMVRHLLEVLPTGHILVVDDNSPDGTGRLADELAAGDARVAVLHRDAKEGLGAAYRAAFGWLLDRPDCSTVIQMDCDFSHDPADVPRLAEAVEQGADLAIGSRYVAGGDTPGWPVARRLISRGGSGFARTVLRLPVRDLTGGFKAWRADLLRSIDLASVGTQGYGFQVEMTWRAHTAGALIRELPIIFGERRAGQSKMSRRIVVEALLMVLRLRVESMGGPRRKRSTRLGVGKALGFGLMRGTRGITVDDLGPVVVVGIDRPAGGGLAAHDARDAQSRD